MISRGSAPRHELDQAGPEPGLELVRDIGPDRQRLRGQQQAALGDEDIAPLLEPPQRSSGRKACGAESSTTIVPGATRSMSRISATLVAPTIRLAS